LAVNYFYLEARSGTGFPLNNKMPFHIVSNDYGLRSAKNFAIAMQADVV